MIIGINGYIGSGKDTVGKMIQFLDLQNKYPNVPGRWDFDFFLNGDHDWTGEWEIKKFAGKLKSIVSLLLDIPVEDLELEEVKQRVLSEEWNWINKGLTFEDKLILIPGIVEQGMEDRAKTLTVRQFLQKLGTDACRNNVHENIWINSLFTDYIPDEGFEYKVRHLGENQLQVLEEPKTYDNGYPDWIITDCRFPNEAQAIKDRGGIVIKVDRVTQADYDLYQIIGFPKNRHSSETSLKDWDFDWIINNGKDLNNLLDETQKMLINFGLWKQEDS